MKALEIAERHGNTFMANSIRNELKKLQSYPEIGIHKYKWAND
jgi:hypothetical protein